MKEIDFIIIGAQKAGTTSLASYLNKNEQIYIPIDKELPYFLYKKLNSKGLGGFLDKYFNSANKGELLGLSTPQYMMNPSVFPEIKKSLPNVKLIAILRNPIDRLVSHYSHAVRLGVEHREIDRVIESQINENNHDKFLDSTTNKYISAGEYGHILEELFKSFDKNKVLIIDFNDFIKNTQINLEHICDFLHIKMDCHKEEFKVKMNGGMKKKINIDHDRLINILSSFTRFLKINHLIPFFVKKSIVNIGSYIDMINVKKNSKKSKNEINADLLEKLKAHYAKDFKKIDKNIASHLNFDDI